jgi:hypothetical protein
VYPRHAQQSAVVELADGTDVIVDVDTMFDV